VLSSDAADDLVVDGDSHQIDDEDEESFLDELDDDDDETLEDLIDKVSGEDTDGQDSDDHDEAESSFVEEETDSDLYEPENQGVDVVQEEGDISFAAVSDNIDEMQGSIESELSSFEAEERDDIDEMLRDDSGDFEFIEDAETDLADEFDSEFDSEVDDDDRDGFEGLDAAHPDESDFQLSEDHSGEEEERAFEQEGSGDFDFIEDAESETEFHHSENERDHEDLDGFENPEDRDADENASEQQEVEFAESDQHGLSFDADIENTDTDDDDLSFVEDWNEFDEDDDTDQILQSLSGNLSADNSVGSDDADPAQNEETQSSAGNDAVDASETSQELGGLGDNTKSESKPVVAEPMKTSQATDDDDKQTSKDDTVGGDQDDAVAGDEKPLAGKKLSENVDPTQDDSAVGADTDPALPAKNEDANVAPIADSAAPTEHYTRQRPQETINFPFATVDNGTSPNTTEHTVSEKLASGSGPKAEGGVSVAIIAGLAAGATATVVGFVAVWAYLRIQRRKILKMQTTSEPIYFPVNQEPIDA
jgi:hypothetical protein